MGHRDLLVTQTYLSSKATTAPFVPREASAAGWLRSNAVPGQVGFSTNISGTTNRELTFLSLVSLTNRLPFPARGRVHFAGLLGQKKAHERRAVLLQRQKRVHWQ
jgi:hypothetical protein